MSESKIQEMKTLFYAVFLVNEGENEVIIRTNSKQLNEKMK